MTDKTEIIEIVTEEPKEEMTEIVGVRFKEAGKIYYFAPNGFVVGEGANVIVETVRGVEFGFVAIANK